MSGFEPTRSTPVPDKSTCMWPWSRSGSLLPKSGVAVSLVVFCGLLCFCLCWSTVTGAACDDGNIRLVGPNEFEGRVEFCLGKKWGQVCSAEIRWNRALGQVAQVVCEQLEFNGTGATFVGDVYGHSDRVSVKSFTSCANPSSVIEFNSSCRFTPAVNTTECTGQEMTGNVICAANQCQENSIRLVNGSNSSEGRVEVCIRSSKLNNTLYYGGVCDNNLDDSFATVVCRELNLTYGTSQVVPGDEAKYSVIGYHNVSCKGNETALSHCSLNILQASKLPVESLLNCTFARVICSGTESTTTAVPHTNTTTDPRSGLTDNTSPVSPISDTLAYVVGGIGVVMLVLILVTIVCIISMIVMVNARKRVRKLEKHVQDSSQSNNVADNDQEVFLQNPFYNNTLRNESTHPQETNGEQVQMSSLDTGYSAISHPKTSVTAPNKQHQYNILQRINSKEYNKLVTVPEYANPILPPLSGVYTQNSSYSNEQVVLPHPYEEPSLPQMYSEPCGDPRTTGTEVPHTYAELELTLPFADSQGYAELDNNDTVDQNNTHEDTNMYQNPRSRHRDHSHTAVPSTDNQRSQTNLYDVVHASDSPDGVTTALPERNALRECNESAKVYYNLSDAVISTPTEVPNTYSEPRGDPHSTGTEVPHTYSEPRGVPHSTGTEVPHTYSEPRGDPHSTGTEVPHTYNEPRGDPHSTGTEVPHTYSEPRGDPHSTGTEVPHTYSEPRGDPHSAGTEVPHTYSEPRGDPHSTGTEVPHTYSEPRGDPHSTGTEVPNTYSEPRGDPHSTGTEVPNTYAELEQNLPIADSQGHVEIEYDDIVVQKKTHEASSHTFPTYQNPRSTHRDHSLTAVPSTVYENQRSYENQTSVRTSDSPDGVEREKYT